MACKSYWLLSAAMVTGCASNSYPLLETAQEPVLVNAPVRTAQSPTEELISSLQVSNLDTVERQGIVAVAAAEAVTPSASPAVDVGILAEVPTTDLSEEGVRIAAAEASVARDARENYFTNVNPVVESDPASTPAKIVVAAADPAIGDQIAAATAPDVNDAPAELAVVVGRPAFDGLVVGRAATPIEIASLQEFQTFAVASMEYAAPERQQTIVASAADTADAERRAGPDTIAMMSADVRFDRTTDSALTSETQGQVFPDAVLAEAADRVINQVPSTEATANTKQPLRIAMADGTGQLMAASIAASVSHQDTAEDLNARQLRQLRGTATPASAEAPVEPASPEMDMPASAPATDAEPEAEDINVEATAGVSVPATDSGDQTMAAAQLALAKVNALRAENNLPPLSLSPSLNEIAKSHVIGLAERGEVTALDAEGRGIGERLQLAGYEPLVAGSLVSGGYAKFDDALNSWLENDVQRSRLLIEEADELGFAVISDRRSTYGVYIEAIVAGSTQSDETGTGSE